MKIIVQGFEDNELFKLVEKADDKLGYYLATIGEDLLSQDVVTQTAQDMMESATQLIRHASEIKI